MNELSFFMDYSFNFQKKSMTTIPSYHWVIMSAEEHPSMKLAGFISGQGL